MIVRSFQVHELPDPRFGPFRAAAGGDVLSEIGAAWEHLLRILAGMLVTAACFIELRMAYRPSADPARLQERLRLTVTIGAASEGTLAALTAAVYQGPLSRFYRFAPCEARDNVCGGTECCEVVRRMWWPRPLPERCRNPHVPARYFAISPFEPRENNDYQMLDHILAGIDEPVTVRLTVSPVDVSPLQRQHLEYLRGLELVNRPWDDDGMSRADEIDYLGGDDVRLGCASRQDAKPFRDRDPLADDLLRAHRLLQETLHLPHLAFGLCASARTSAIARMVGSVLAESAFADGSYQLVLRDSAGSAPPITHQPPRGEDAACPVEPLVPADQDVGALRDLVALANVALVCELASAVRLPTAGIASPACIRRNTDPTPPPEGEPSLVIGQDLEIYTTASVGGINLQLPLSVLAKGASIFGLPGSGKTTLVIDMVRQLRAVGIPVLIIETAKHEYRRLKRFRSHPDPDIRALAESIQIFSVGAEDVSPSRYNPLALAAGVSVDEHVELLMTPFEASMPLEGPLLAILREALLKIYKLFPDRNSPPVLADLRRVVEQVLTRKGYSEETDSNVRAAIDVRLGLLTEGLVGRILQSPYSSPTVEQLMSGLVVLELDRLPRQAACLHALSLLTSIRQNLRGRPPSGPVQIVIFVEEAHNIVGPSTDAKASTDTPDPRAFAADAVARALAEHRALGGPLVIVDQLPSAVAPQVIKNTATKIAFRQVDLDDRTALGGSMLCDQAETDELARLRPGVAYYFTEGYFRPRRLRTANLHSLLDLTTNCSDADLRRLIADEPWFKRAASERRMGELERFQRELNRLDDRRLAISRKLTMLRSRQRRLLEQRTSVRQRRRDLVCLRGVARRFRETLRALAAEFPEAAVVPLLGDAPGFDDGLKAWWQSLHNRWMNVTWADTARCVESFTRFIRDCR